MISFRYLIGHRYRYPENLLTNIFTDIYKVFLLKVLKISYSPTYGSLTNEADQLN